MSRPAFTIKADEANPQKVVLTIIGELSINNTIEIKESLLENLDKFDQITLNLQDIVNLDVSGIQLIQSLKLAKPNHFEINATLQDDIKLIIEKSGFNTINITQL